MGCTTFELREKDVINVCNGQRLGCVSELELDTDCGKISALIVGTESLSSILFGRGRVRVPWDRIKRIGKDTILVDIPFFDENKCDDCESDLECKVGEKCNAGKRPKWFK